MNNSIPKRFAQLFCCELKQSCIFVCSVAFVRSSSNVRSDCDFWLMTVGVIVGAMYSVQKRQIIKYLRSCHCRGYVTVPTL